MITLKKDDFFSLAHGTCFYASGGGGAITAALKLIRQMPENASVTCVSLSEALSDNKGLTATVAFMGAPDAFKNPMYPPLDVIEAFKELDAKANTKYHKSINYLIPIEIGALSVAAIYMVAFEINKDRPENEKIKIIDADGAGRAVPQLTLLTFASNGLSCNPSLLSRVIPNSSNNSSKRKISQITAFTSSGSGINYNPVITSKNENKYNVSIEIEDASQIENMARIIISDPIYGEYAGLALWIMTATELAKADPVTGYIIKSLELGKKLRKAGKVTFTPLFHGKLKSIETATSGGFDHGLATFSSQDETFFIYIQNESLIGWTNSKSSPMVMAPDLICYLADEFVIPEGCPEPIRVLSNASDDWNAFKNKNITIYGLPCDKKLKTEKMSEAFYQLRMALGYPGVYIPIMD